MSLETEIESIYFDMSQVSNICNIKIKKKAVGRNELFKLLRKKRILQEGNNLPYKRFIDAGYFKVQKNTIKRIDQYDRESQKTLVSQKGVELIKEMFKEN